VEKLTHADLHAQDFYNPRYRIEEHAHQGHFDFFTRSELMGRNKPVTWEDDIMKGEIIECGIESIRDYESTADVLDAVTQHRDVVVQTVVEDMPE